MNRDNDGKRIDKYCYINASFGSENSSSSSSSGGDGIRTIKILKGRGRNKIRVNEGNGIVYDVERRGKNDWRYGLLWLEGYLLKEYPGWRLEYSGGQDSAIEPRKELIKLSTKHNDETIYYCFLHELGHIRIIKNDILWEKYRRVFDERSEVSLVYKTCVVEEEIEAWNIGYSIAIENNLPMKRKRFEELKASMLSTYMLWTLSRKINNSDNNSS